MDDSMGTMSMSMPTSTASSAMHTGMSGMDMGGMDMGGGSSCQISMLWNWNTIDACFLSTSWHIRSRGMFAGSCIGVICLVLCLEFLRRVSREYDAFIVRRARLRRLYMSGSPPARGSPSGYTTGEQPGPGDSTQGPKTTTTTNSSCVPGRVNSVKGGCCDGPDLTSSASSIVKEDVITPAPEPGSDDKGLNRITSTAAGAFSAQNTPTTPTAPPAAAVASSPRFASDPATLEPYRASPVEQTVRALLHMLQFAVAYFVMLLAMYFNGYIIICIFIGAFLGAFIFSWEPVSLGKG
ncbi:hypothetical protein NUU61_005064 [Penicillium alfredii]|uniref:Copper transport protein n=1 Tax=Penicillium alfredii TaxID=1506179 RepID=A0A9W9F8V0_9EURO|nr:uncharacterized protein NUU61_005064 [Penicillium alfredii]KAJ5095708.1 hypothetical protein NUU61_005064 [Penicillium alfredii]